MVIYFDGACGPVNPGGVVQYGFWEEGPDGESIHEDYGIAFSGGPVATNNVAEYTAMAAGLIYVLGKATRVPVVDRKLILRGDSQLTINQFNGDWRVRKGSLRAIAALVHMLRDELHTLGWEVTAEWVHGSNNVLADKLSRRALNEAKMDRLPMTEKQNDK